MTPVPAAGSRPAGDTAPLSAVTVLLLVPVVPEQFLDVPPLLLQPVQRQAQVRDGVPHDVVGLFAVDPDQQPAASRAPGLEATRTWLTRVKLVMVSERRSRPPSMTTSWSQICSISPSRCEETTIEMPNSAPILLIRSSMERRRPGPGRWSAHRATAAADPRPGPGPA